MATSTITGEDSQLAQTIEMFEVITQSQPTDYQSLEILKEAYLKLGREKDVINTSKRIAQAYVQMGQLSSAILEYETILQRFPNDADVKAALKEIEGKASNFPVEGATEVVSIAKKNGDTSHHAKPAARTAVKEVDDGRRIMHKLFVESKLVTPADFEQYWPKPDPIAPPGKVIEPFIQVLQEKGLGPLDRSLKMLCDRSRCAYLPLHLYDVDIDLTRQFPAETCQRWCVLPLDRMSKSILVATANPFNQQAAKELASATPYRLLWYVTPPAEIVKNLRKAFR